MKKDGVKLGEMHMNDVKDMTKIYCLIRDTLVDGVGLEFDTNESNT